MGNVIGQGKRFILVDDNNDPVAIDTTTGALSVSMADDTSRGIGSALLTYAQFDAHASSATIITDATNGINTDAITNCLEIIIQADYENTGYVMVGSQHVAADTNGIRLYAGDTLVLNIASTSTVYTIGSTSSQKVNVSILRQ